MSRSVTLLSVRRRIPSTLVFLASALSGCGGAAGFRIDNVTLSPDDIPVSTSSPESLHVGADVFDDNHLVTNVWVTSASNTFWLDLIEGTDPHWSAAIPLANLAGFPAGNYVFDVHAVDDAGRTIVRTDAIRLKIQLN
jgi:hypothetical protein